MRKVVFLLGAPGTGKSTLARALLGARATESGRWTVGSEFAAPGIYTGGALDGPDSLPPSEAALQTILERMAEVPPRRVVLLDGERYARPWAVRWLERRASLSAVLLEAPIPVLRERRAQRGSRSMPLDWYAKRIERAAGQAKLMRPVHRVDASMPAAEVEREVRAILSEVQAKQ